MIKNLSLYSQVPTEETIDSYPTIIDILETIALQENGVQRHLLPYSEPYFLPPMNHKGQSIVVCSDTNRNEVALFPASQRMYVFYRGQSCYYPECKPSLYRNPTSNSDRDLLLYRLQSQELLCILLSHPVIYDITHRYVETQEYKFKVPVNHVALAQHYGISTPLLDITADKWTAAFFATTDFKNGQYYVHRKKHEFQSQYGVYYIVDMQHYVNLSAGYVYPVGLQYFNRPGCQSALVVDLTEKKDFHQMPFAKPIFFRHDDACNDLVFTMHDEGNFLFPDDSLAEVVERMVKKKHQIFYSGTVECVHALFYFTETLSAFCQRVEAEGWSIVDHLAATFDPNKMEQDKQNWINGDNQRWLDHIVTPRLVYDLNSK